MCEGANGEVHGERVAVELCRDEQEWMSAWRVPVTVLADHLVVRGGFEGMPSRGVLDGEGPEPEGATGGRFADIAGRLG